MSNISHLLYEWQTASLRLETWRGAAEENLGCNGWERTMGGSGRPP